MDAVDKRANNVALNARDEQRLRNHQLRMMRRAWLNDLKVSPREPLYPANDIYWGRPALRLSFNFHNYWKLLSDKLFLPKGVRPFYHQAFLDELFYGRIQNVPQMAVWGSFRMLRMIVWFFPGWFLFKVMNEQICLSKYPTAYGCLPHMNRSMCHASQAEVYPSDKTFTTRLRNVEWGHDYINLKEFTPRMRPDAETFPAGTRMNWVTFQPVYPEDNYLLNENYGNGPGGVGRMTETYRLVHATKPTGLYSKIDPDEPHMPFNRYVRRLLRTITNHNQVDEYTEEKTRPWTLWHADSGSQKSK